MKLVVAHTAASDEDLALGQSAPSLLRSRESDRQSPQDGWSVKVNAGLLAEVDRPFQDLDSLRRPPFRKNYLSNIELTKWLEPPRSELMHQS
jgi:hypothetical protein